MYQNEQVPERAVLVGVHTSDDDIIDNSSYETLEELSELARTAGAVVVGQMLQNKIKKDNATYIGSGKLIELSEFCKNTEADMVIFDDELTPSQIRNIEREVSVKVIDRSSLILDIFASRAISKEGKIQVELAQLKYNLPRLTGRGVALSRLGGGIGTRGPGETKLESDKRHIRNRISVLEQELKEIEERRDVLRRKREKENYVTAALVGYTNAGKSTLLNLLTDSNIFAENLLFATLDPTARRLDLPDGRNAVLIDTVGFIRKLPHHLIDAFKSTLEEATRADVILHVIDASNPSADEMIEVSDRLLASLNCKAKTTIAVFNKCDVIENTNIRPKGKYDDFVFVSAKTGENIDKLKEKLDQYLPGKKKKVKLLIPYTNSSLSSRLHSEKGFIKEEFTENGTVLELMCDDILYSLIKEYEINE